MLTLRQITSRLEINALGVDVNPLTSAEFALKNSVPAIVTLPEHVPSYAVYRSTTNAPFKIIAAIDWPDGRNFALDKFKTLAHSFMAADGFDIVLTPNKSQIETTNEIRYITELFKKNINSLVEIRWSIEACTQSKETIAGYLDAMRLWPPTFVRLDHRLRHQTTTAEDTVGMVDMIMDKLTSRIKISTNVDLSTILRFSNEKFRFDVDFDQALSLVREHGLYLTKEQAKLEQEQTKQEQVKEEQAKLTAD